MMDLSDEWLFPQLSLESEALMQIQRAQLRECNEAQLLMFADALLQQWFMHRQVIMAAFAKIQKMKVEALLADAEPSKPEPAAEHYAWAAELLGQRASSS